MLLDLRTQVHLLENTCTTEERQEDGAITTCTTEERQEDGAITTRTTEERQEDGAITTCIRIHPHNYVNTHSGVWITTDLQLYPEGLHL